ncbi:UDP-glucose 4-epimerase GalE [Oxalobacter vibrioformis]|uniref:UDP-glucose 4-epimerase n=1 Tax=Oxalobacter vibrioformis TaxID=933080 RepID=A0A9E9P338_9BURK|nr:UDP-glucose 4-epimerase GalE [Oxalobacter vibrioformis]WAW10589.1 UDP-glucose 4-epimerase GalE [Oxalobacter vibrioformis]
MTTSILVTGGTGYIGSHTVVQLMQRGNQVVILDNLSNSNRKVLDRIEQICAKRPVFIEGDIRDRKVLKKIFHEHAISAVIHFAGLKAVGEGEEKPFLYYENNVAGSVVLFQEMAEAGIYTLIFSSSATVYGDPGYARFDEQTPVSAVNVYGRTKQMVEDILRDGKKALSLWNVALLRYFNPVGAHVSGLMGEDPTGIPNNLMPFISQVAVGKREMVSVFGSDYPTEDGTGVRDYIHVEDLASAHLAALDKLMKEKEAFITVNIGTGRPYSVLEVIKAFEKASGKTVPYQITDRRPGDIAACYADPTLAKELLGWQAQYDIHRMCEDTWRWQENNPTGYQ